MDEVVLCGSSCYTKKFYLNPEFEGLPPMIKDELKVMCVLYTEALDTYYKVVFLGEGGL